MLHDSSQAFKQRVSLTVLKNRDLGTMIEQNPGMIMECSQGVKGMKIEHLYIS